MRHTWCDYDAATRAARADDAAARFRAIAALLDADAACSTSEAGLRAALWAAAGAVVQSTAAAGALTLWLAPALGGGAGDAARAAGGLLAAGVCAWAAADVAATRAMLRETGETRARLRRARGASIEAA